MVTIPLSAEVALVAARIVEDTMATMTILSRTELERVVNGRLARAFQPAKITVDGLAPLRWTSHGIEV